MLDLDALEQITKEPGFRGFDWMERRLMGDGHYSIIQHRVDGIPALIEQLRKAEIDLEASHEREMALSIRTAKAEAALQEKQDELDVAYGKGSGYSEGEQRWFSALDRANARIAQLERVREIAHKIDMGTPVERVKWALRAALAAVEEK